MTTLEYTRNLINGLEKALKYDLELLEQDRRNFIKAVERNNVMDIQLANKSYKEHKAAMERRQEQLRAYKQVVADIRSSLHEHSWQVHGNYKSAREKPLESDLDPNRFLCDKIWYRWHNR